MQLVDDLLELYPAPPGPMIEEMKKRARMIPEDRIQDVYNAILEDANTSQKIGVKHILDACRKLSISTRDYSDQVVDVKKRDCDCCGFTFRYHPLPTAEQQVDRDWHCACPHCGFQVSWTIDRNNDVKMRGEMPEWYARLITRFRDSANAFGPGKQRGLYFKRSQVAKELQKEGQAHFSGKSSQQLQEEVRELVEQKRYVHS
jgi:hypothetical protein